MKPTAKDITKRELKKAFKKRVKAMKAHFDKDGWDIRADLAQVLLDEFDFDPDVFIRGAVPGIKLYMGRFGLIYSRGKNIEYAVYDEYQNKIVMMPLGSKKYPDEQNGYYWLGVV